MTRSFSPVTIWKKNGRGVVSNPGTSAYLHIGQLYQCLQGSEEGVGPRVLLELRWIQNATIILFYKVQTKLHHARSLHNTTLGYSQYNPYYCMLYSTSCTNHCNAVHNSIANVTRYTKMDNNTCYTAEATTVNGQHCNHQQPILHATCNETLHIPEVHSVGRAERGTG